MSQTSHPSFHPGVGPFAQAVTASKRAAIWAAGGDGVCNVDPNPSGRELDPVVATIILTHATIECAWRWEQGAARLDETFKWPKHYDEAIARIAETKRRPPPPPAPRRESFLLLAAWRSFFQHGDASSRQRLSKRLGRSSWEDLADLNAHYAREIIALADEVLEHLAASTGGPRIGPSTIVWTGMP